MEKEKEAKVEVEAEAEGGAEAVAKRTKLVSGACQKVCQSRQSCQHFAVSSLGNAASNAAALILAGGS